jgi:4-hydroxy-2-oxoheptanedioate aldolase
VRAPGADAFFIQRALDLGADGVVVPQVADADAASRAVAMMRYAPHGTRGYNPFTRGGRYGQPPQPKLAPDYPFAGVMVESPAAAAHLERIVAVPSLDFVYLGIFDYSVAIGAPGQVDDPRVLAFVERSARIVRDAGKAIGTTAMSPAQADRLVAQGVNLLFYGTDTWLVGRGAKEALALYASAGRR